MNMQAAPRRFANADWIGLALVTLGFTLSMTVGTMRWAAFLWLGGCLPLLLREAGWLRDGDEYQRQHMRRAGLHAFLAMGLALDRKTVTPQANARVLAVWNAVINFTAGEHFLRPMLDMNTPDYQEVVKETLRFILIPAFVKA